MTRTDSLAPIARRGANLLQTGIAVLVFSLAVAACGSSSTANPPAGTGGSGSGGSGSGGSGSGGSTAMAGSSGGSSGGGGAAATACDALNKVFIPKCATVGCHVPNGAFKPDLSTEKAVAAVVGASQINPCAADMKSSMINPSAPLSGSLLLWIAGPTCREQMPFGGAPLSADDIACVKSYFTAKLK